MSRIKIGDKIKFLNDGGVYSTYDKFFEYNHLDELKQRFKYGDNIEISDKEYLVIAKGKHNTFKDAKILVIEEVESRQIYLAEITNPYRDYVEKIIDNKNTI